MKTIQTKLTLTILLMVACTALFAQSKSDRLFDTFKNKPGVSYFDFNKNMQDAFNIDLDEGKTITGDLHEIRFMAYNPEKGELDGHEFLRKAIGLLPAAYDRLASVDDESNLDIFVLGKKHKAKEFHVLVHNDSPNGRQFVVSFYGDFDLKKDVDGLREISISMSK